MLSLHFYGGISNESLHFYEGKFVDLQLSSILSFVSLKNGAASATPFFRVLILRITIPHYLPFRYLIKNLLYCRKRLITRFIRIIHCNYKLSAIGQKEVYVIILEFVEGDFCSLWYCDGFQ